MVDLEDQSSENVLVQFSLNFTIGKIAAILRSFKDVTVTVTNFLIELAKFHTPPLFFALAFQGGCHGNEFWAKLAN